jgi:hypothetical protein
VGRVVADGDLQRMKDQEHLRLLVVGYYVYAGVNALFSLMPLLHVGMGVLMLTTPGFMAPPRSGAGGPPPQWFGWFFIAFGACFILVGETLALLNLVAARCIAARRRRIFCYVVAGFDCINVPFGTLLGVFTFLVLGRQSVQAEFDGIPVAAEAEASRWPGTI